jgi:FixJ family two-component response regulator/GGDEF domain-containing protein
MAKARILAVDDQLYFRTFLDDVLTQEGYEVVTATSGEEALRLLERERFDVVLTDLVMPAMDGCTLVRRIKEQWPDQDVVVVTSVGDVKTAVEAMRGGATDYQLKPIDRQALCCSLDALLQRRRLREEHERLMAENLEFLGVLSLYERASALFATLAVEPLVERIVEGLCLETRAQGGLVWVVREEGAARMRLLGLRGLVRVENEPEELAPGSLAPEIEALVRGEHASARVLGEDGSEAFWLALRRAGRTLGLVRLTDRIDRRAFPDRDRASAEKLAELAAQALSNALRFRALEHRSFRDPATRAYTPAFLQDVARNEIQKASRFARAFSLIAVDLGGAAAVRGAESARVREAVAYALTRVLRSTDLVALDDDGRFTLLLPETDALGAAVLKRRAREAIDGCDVLPALGDAQRRPILAAVSFGADGTQLESLCDRLEARLEEERGSIVAALALEAKAFGNALGTLLERPSGAPASLADDAMRFLLSEVSRRPRERGLLFVAPGGPLTPALREAVEGLRGVEARTEVVLVAEGGQDAVAGTPVTCLSPRRAGTRAGFAVHFGEGPAYTLVHSGDGAGEPGGLFHSDDRALAEHLAFQLQRELGIAVAP